MRRALTFALLLATPLLTLGAIDVTQSQYAAGSTCGGATTVAGTGTKSSGVCQDAGANSFKVTCSGLRHGAFSLAEYTGNGCTGTSPAATYPGADSTSCISATLINAQFKADCLVPCAADTDCNGAGHGTCTVATGVCACTGGYTGDSCMTAPTGTNACPTGSTQCGEHGACKADQSACECTDGYTGDACATAPACATCDDAGHGSCKADFSGCTCTGGYTGSSTFKCDVAPACATTCGAHGFCNTDGTGCTCTDGYSGDACATLPVANSCLTASTQCGDHGSCNAAQNACVCRDGFRGNDCSVAADTTCTDATCKNGNCEAGVCKCDADWSGANCDVETADQATLTYYTGNTCAAATKTSSVDVSLDSCTKFLDNAHSGSVLCPNGVNGAFTLKTYSTSTTCGGTADTPLQGQDNTDCIDLPGDNTGYVTVTCSRSGAVAMQASLLLVAVLAFISKYMQ